MRAVDGPPRFIADGMLGTLARWLRLCGFDTVFDPALDDPEIAARAAREDRVVLTRDRGLLARRLVTRGLLVEDADLGTQLRQVVAAFGLEVPEDALFSRCAACNGAVRRVASKDEVAHRVPPFVLRTHDAFLRCPDCGRIYWAGTHRALALERLRKLLDPGPAGRWPEADSGLDEPGDTP